ncbi:hypothetical protein [Spirillospora sp. NPDC048823]|uniref:hypothetical protein n=1 Tax=unclassified Spirillospora TaxID=2642701 RepID=UPI00371AAB89
MTEAASRPRSGAGETGAIVFAFIIVSVLAVVLVATSPAPGSLDRLPDPPAGPDRIPAGPVITAIPVGCGISPATVGRLVTEPRMMKDGHRDGECMWSSGSDDGSRHHLSIALTLTHGTAALSPSGPATGRSPLAAAMKSFGPRWSDATTRAVTGLGDEALVQFAPSAGVSVVARVGNATVSVQYRDARGSIPERTARDGAFAAAAEVVDRLGARTPSRPAIAPAPDPSPARKIPDLCGSISERTLNRLLGGEQTPGPSGTSGSGGLAIKDADHRGCSRTSADRELTVTAAVVPGTDLFDGPRLATREYTMRHDDARAEETLSVHDRKYFHAVTGLGDQAFAAHVPGVVPGVVVFRDGALLVQVNYEEADERRPLSGEHAVRGAYAAAQEVAQALAVH